MKKSLRLIGVFLLLLAGREGFSQARESNEGGFAYERPAPQLFITPGTGINTHQGVFGVSLEYNFGQNFSAFGGVGVGSWGYKMGAGVRYYVNYPASWAFNLGLSRATGLSQIAFDMEPSMVLGGGSGNREVTFHLKPVNNLHLTAIKYWALGRRKANRIHLEFGYAVNLTEDFYSADAALSNEGHTFMSILRPGGLVIGTGFSFGL